MQQITDEKLYFSMCINQDLVDGLEDGIDSFQLIDHDNRVVKLQISHATITKIVNDSLDFPRLDLFAPFLKKELAVFYTKEELKEIRKPLDALIQGLIKTFPPEAVKFFKKIVSYLDKPFYLTCVNLCRADIGRGMEVTFPLSDSVKPTDIKACFGVELTKEQKKRSYKIRSKEVPKTNFKPQLTEEEKNAAKNEKPMEEMTKEEINDAIFKKMKIPPNPNGDGIDSIKLLDKKTGKVELCISNNMCERIRLDASFEPLSAIASFVPTELSHTFKYDTEGMKTADTCIKPLFKQILALVPKDSPIYIPFSIIIEDTPLILFLTLAQKVSKGAGLTFIMFLSDTVSEEQYAEVFGEPLSAEFKISKFELRDQERSIWEKVQPQLLIDLNKNGDNDGNIEDIENADVRECLHNVNE